MGTKTFIGIDNGSTGSIGLIKPDGTSLFIGTPHYLEQNYTKKKQNIGRIDIDALEKFLRENVVNMSQSFCMVERPMVNPTRFSQSMSAARSLEATIIVLERLGIPFQYIDSKEWQKVMLPQGTKGSPELKKASREIGARLFPQFKDEIKRQKDADGILITEYARRKYGTN